jgi:hypothetical protein
MAIVGQQPPLGAADGPPITDRETLWRSARISPQQQTCDNGDDDERYRPSHAPSTRRRSRSYERARVTSRRS